MHYKMLVSYLKDPRKESFAVEGKSGTGTLEAGEMARQLRALVGLPEEQGSDPSTCMAASTVL